MTESKILQEQFPFLTLFNHAGEEMIGIVQNQTKNVISVYVYNRLIGTENKRDFLELGNIWWWESNRKIPIHLFLKQDFDRFEPIIMNFSNKEVKIIQGPVVSIQALNQKRIKRRRIELVKQA